MSRGAVLVLGVGVLFLIAGCGSSSTSTSGQVDRVHTVQTRLSEAGMDATIKPGNPSNPYLQGLVAFHGNRAGTRGQVILSNKSTTTILAMGVRGKTERIGTAEAVWTVNEPNHAAEATVRRCLS